MQLDRPTRAPGSRSHAVRERATALILLAVVDHDVRAGEEAIRIAHSLPPDDPGRRKAEAASVYFVNLAGYDYEPR